jgi:hypothetical protein
MIESGLGLMAYDTETSKKRVKVDVERDGRELGVSDSEHETGTIPKTCPTFRAHFTSCYSRKHTAIACDIRDT